MQPSSQPLGRPNMPIPPSTFLANSLPGGQLSSTHNQNFNGASAVAALAAVVSAAMQAVQSKSTGGGGSSGTNLPGAIQQQSLTNSQLQQRNSLNAITNALRAANPNWNAMMTNALNSNNNNNNNSNNRLNTTNSNNNSNNNNNNNNSGSNSFNPRCLPFQ
ncbi:unnamed protein product [Trichobilharzia szidati]|nr:unnamed protein product [Trichobilharzia szidati]